MTRFTDTVRTAQHWVDTTPIQITWDILEAYIIGCWPQLGEQARKDVMDSVVLS